MGDIIRGTIKAAELSDEKKEMTKFTRRFKLPFHKYSPSMRYTANLMNFGVHVMDLAKREFFNINIDTKGKVSKTDNWVHYGWSFVGDDEIMIVAIRDKLFEIHNVKINFEHRKAYIDSTRKLSSSEAIQNIRFHVDPIHVDKKQYLIALINKDSKAQFLLLPTKIDHGGLLELNIPEEFTKDKEQFSFNKRSFFVDNHVLLVVKNNDDTQVLLKFDISKLVFSKDTSLTLTSENIESVEKFPKLLSLDAYFLENYFQFENFMILRKQSSVYVADLRKMTLKKIDPQTKHSCFFSIYMGSLVRWDYAVKMNLDRECCCPCCDRDYAKGVVGYKKWPMSEQTYIKKVYDMTQFTYWVYPDQLAEDTVADSSAVSLKKIIFGPESYAYQRQMAISDYAIGLDIDFIVESFADSTI